ncbi:hypothetical protein V494_01008 [Pseudogymnoascus sp. VKM F-4513 (FW-928)]|nr:hypothetical protein V494_01008 [Pseudogymnoascus sp. VKM F-4513 (FW-928)]
MRPQLSSTLVEAAPPATRLSLSIMPKPRWKNPELSVGTPHASLDLLGRYKCWSVKDGSPAHVVWKAASKAITNLLEDQYEHLDAGGSELMVEMFMIGRKLANSIPTILFSCESKTCRQKALVLVKKKGILTNHLGVVMAESSKLPRPLALDKQTDAPSLSPGVYLNGPLRSFGTSILIYSDEGKPPRKATIGGIITINHELYGGTAAHAFFPVKDEEDSETEDLEFAFFGDEDPYDSDSGDDEDLVTITSKASMSSRSSQSPGTDESGYKSLASKKARPAYVEDIEGNEDSDNNRTIPGTRVSARASKKEKKQRNDKDKERRVAKEKKKSHSDDGYPSLVVPTQVDERATVKEVRVIPNREPREGRQKSLNINPRKSPRKSLRPPTQWNVTFTPSELPSRPRERIDQRYFDQRGEHPVVIQAQSTPRPPPLSGSAYYTQPIYTTAPILIPQQHQNPMQIAYASSSSASNFKKLAIEAADNATVDIDVEKTPVKLGELFASTEAGDRLDWALVKIQSPPLKLQFTRLYDSYNKIWGEKLRYPRSIRDATIDVRVLIFTGSEGVVEGSLSTVTSFSLNSNSHKFQPLLTVRRLAGKFSDGDCGSWVFDKETRDVYGHIVSGYPSTGTAYIVPSVQTFEDIQKRIGKPIEFFAHTSKESQDNTYEGSDSAMRGTNIPNFDARWRRLLAVPERLDRILSEPLDPNQLSQTAYPAPQISTKATDIFKNIDLPSGGKPRIRRACDFCRVRKFKCTPEKSSCFACIRSGRTCSFRRAHIVSADDDGKQVSETEGSGFTKDRSHVQEMQMPGSDDNTVSSRAIRASRRQREIKYQLAKASVLGIEAISDVNLSNEASPPLSTNLEEDSDTKSESSVSASWVCTEPQDGIRRNFEPFRSMSECRTCHQGKRYSSYDKAASHLRRVHFKYSARDHGGFRKIYVESELGAVKGGGDWPPMWELGRWMQEVYGEANDEEPSDEEMHASYGDLVGKKSLDISSNQFARKPVSVSSYNEINSDLQNTPLDMPMAGMGIEISPQAANFDSPSSDTFTGQQPGSLLQPIDPYDSGSIRADQGMVDMGFELRPQLHSRVVTAFNGSSASSRRKPHAREMAYSNDSGFYSGPSGPNSLQQHPR